MPLVGYSGRQPPDYGLLSHADLMMARRMLPEIDPGQEILGPLEHRAFARETVQDNPQSAVALMGLIPGYQAAKWIGRGNLGPVPAALARIPLSAFGGNISPPSLAQMGGGFRGMLEGLFPSRGSGGW